MEKISKCPLPVLVSLPASHPNHSFDQQQRYLQQQRITKYLEPLLSHLVSLQSNKVYLQDVPIRPQDMERDQLAYLRIHPSTSKRLHSYSTKRRPSTHNNLLIPHHIFRTALRPHTIIHATMRIRNQPTIINPSRKPWNTVEPEVVVEAAGFVVGDADLHAVVLDEAFHEVVLDLGEGVDAGAGDKREGEQGEAPCDGLEAHGCFDLGGEGQDLI